MIEMRNSEAMRMEMVDVAARTIQPRVHTKHEVEKEDLLDVLARIKVGAWLPAWLSALGLGPACWPKTPKEDLLDVLARIKVPGCLAAWALSAGGPSFALAPAMLRVSAGWSGFRLAGTATATATSHSCEPPATATDAHHVLLLPLPLPLLRIIPCYSRHQRHPPLSCLSRSSVPPLWRRRRRWTRSARPLHARMGT